MSFEDFFFGDAAYVEQKPVEKIVKHMVYYERQYIDPSWTIRKQLSLTPPRGWEKIFTKITSTLNLLCDILERPNNLNRTPLNHELFEVFHLCPPENIRVVILGESPSSSISHDGSTEAMGVAYSGRPGYKVPALVVPIHQELDRQIKGLNPHLDGDLTNWVRQGVFLLNTVLTHHFDRDNPVRFWVGFVTSIIEEIVRINPKVIFVLWGIPVQNFVTGDLMKILQNDVRVLRCAHPLSRAIGENSFTYNNHFLEINKILRERNENEIDWNTHY